MFYHLLDTARHMNLEHYHLLDTEMLDKVDGLLVAK